MDPVTLIVVPGFLGGLVIAAIVVILQRRSSRDSSVVVPYRQAPLTTDVINMASIKVAGIGGLGLVAMAAAVALDVRRIGETIALGIGCGIVVAVVMIVRRRASGSMPSSGGSMGANTILALDDADLNHSRNESNRETPPLPSEHRIVTA